LKLSDTDFFAPGIVGYFPEEKYEACDTDVIKKLCNFYIHCSVLIKLVSVSIKKGFEGNQNCIDNDK
jgi:hypothetical protein